ncbi:DUF3231 family protein [Cytobacillus horneckiae]|uniref:DUF3231 family protein n=1 Tax=Cytobacillus horneckiae TaxID=549687 RepID=UPI003D9AAF9C
MQESRIDLTSSEIASLWTSYNNNSMSIQILSYLLSTVEDADIKTMIEIGHSISDHHLEQIEAILQAEKIPVPTGFSASDVNLNAPRLYTDHFMLNYVNHMSKAGMLGYSGFLSLSAREDIRKFFKDTLIKTSELFDESAALLLQKGLYVRAPFIDYPKQKDFVDSKSYFKGLNPFSNKRPLNAVEISHLHLNFQNNIVGIKLATSFAQSSPRKEVQKLLLRGKEISEKHVKVFSDTLIKNNIQSPVNADSSITNSTAQVFSDKLVMFHMGMLTAAGTGNYATAAAASQRNDLILNYERLSLEIAQYAKDIANLMIDNEWLEQPPGTMDKEQLIYQKKQNE